MTSRNSDGASTLMTSLRTVARIEVDAARVVADEDRLLHDEEGAAPHQQRHVVEHGGGDLVAIARGAQARQRRIGHGDLREAGQRVGALALGALLWVSRIGSSGSVSCSSGA